MRYPPSVLDDVRARLPVSSVVGRRVALKRRGREFVGLSPFKSEKTPSFTVNDQKGFFHCFASGEHGDIFGFLMKTEGLSFAEAVERLAEEAGVVLPKASPEAAKEEDRRERLLAANEAACRFFESMLATPRGREARDYLDRRGISPALSAQFRMGFAPDARDALRQHLVAKGFDIALQAEAGLLIAGDDIPQPYDRFRGRLIIPITDLAGKIVAFGGRALAAEAKPKYLNSPETPLFHKGSVLFNAFAARKAAPTAGEIVVVEGYLDVVALFGAGIAHAVAPLGTALTEAQLALLWRIVPEPTLCLDGDAAGQRAAMRVADLALPLIQPERSLRFAFLPTGLDPDDLVRQQGAGAMLGVLRQALPLSEVLWRRERDAEPLDTPERRSGLERRLDSLAKRIRDPSLAAEYGREFRRRAREALWQRVVESGGQKGGARAAGRFGDWRTRELTGKAQRSRATLPARPVPGEELMRHGIASRAAEVGLHREATILRALLNHPELLDDLAEELAHLQFRNSLLSSLRDALLSVHASTSPLDSAALATHLNALGHNDALGLIARAITHRSDRFTEVDAPEDRVRMGLREALAKQEKAILEEQLNAPDLIRAVGEGSVAAEAQLMDLQARLRIVEGRLISSTDSGL